MSSLKLTSEPKTAKGISENADFCGFESRKIVRKKQVLFQYHHFKSDLLF